MKSPRNIYILFGNQNICKNGFNKWYKLKCFFKNKTETVESHLYQFFSGRKIQNVNNNNFKIVGYQTNVSISRFFHIYIQL